MAAKATVTYTHRFSNLERVTQGTGVDFTIALTYSDFITTTGMQALGASLPTTLGFDALNAGTNTCGWWAFCSTGGSLGACGLGLSRRRKAN